ncbi:MAG: response regulator transcription factor [Acidobacteria bacterium]|nr:response regulator transcription factor [Acidobacteriota bacterium]
MAEPKRILVVDDEPLARQRIVRYIREARGDFLIAEAESGIRAVELIQSFQPEILFLDIEMPGLNGLEVLQQFGLRSFQVIFQTAYDQFAIQAFEENACDYLLKPFTAERLHQALSRALSRVADEKKLRALESRLAERNGYLRQLVIKQGNRLRVVTEQELHCFVSRDHYTCVYFGDARQALEGICDLSLARLAERLDPNKFRQVHRNSIIKISSILALGKSKDGEVCVELVNGMKLPVSRSNQRAVKQFLESER